MFKVLHTYDIAVTEAVVKFLSYTYYFIACSTVMVCTCLAQGVALLGPVALLE